MIALAAARREDFDEVVALLSAARLPTDDVLTQFPAAFVVARDGGALVGLAGLEVHGAAGLLRSVVVREALRSTGLGKQLVADRLQRARTLGLGAVYLLTTTAAPYFARLGFMLTKREDAPEQLRASSEFAHACPASATCLVRAVQPSDFT